MRDQTLLQRQTALVGMNVAWLNQALQLLGEVDDAAYARIGGHVRHAIEYYECFLEGLATMHVDYDTRRRDSAVERDRQCAASRIRELIARLAMEPELRGDGTMFVRVEDATGQDVPEPFLLSSVGRELQSLSSHTVHHFALVSMILRSMGYGVEESFGVAPSTLRHREETKIAARPRLLVPAA